MSGLLLACLSMLLLGIAGTVALSRVRPGQAAWIAVGSVAATGLFWLLGRDQVPWQWFGMQVVSDFPRWGVRVDAVSWQATAWLLLLGMAVIGSLAMRGRSREATWALSLILVGSLPLWADTVASWLIAFSALVAAWWVGQFILAGAEQRIGNGLWWRLGAIGLCPPLVWLDTTLAGGGDIALGALPASPWTSLAAVIMLGISPWANWRPSGEEESSPLIPLLAGIVSTNGIVLLARETAVGPTGAGTTITLSVVGLIWLLAGVGLAWRSMDMLDRAANSLALALGGLVLLSAVWAGPVGTMAEGRTLVLVCGALWLLAWRQADLGHRVAALAAAAAMAGLPLTAAFTGRGELIDTWVADSRWLLLAVAVFLLIPLVAAGLVSTRAWQRIENRRPSWGWLWPLLPLIGLLSVRDLGQVGVVPWAILVAIAILAGGLSWRLGDAADIAPVFRQGLTLAWMPSWSFGWLGASLSALRLALREAVNILESEGGMLWLLLFLVIFWLAGS